MPGLQNLMSSPVNPRAVPELEPQTFPIYDHQVVGTTQGAQINFFRQGFTNGRTQRETNMESFPLPNPLVAHITGFSIHIIPPQLQSSVAMVITDIGDYQRLLYNGVFQFQIGSGGKLYTLGNLYAYPSGMGLSGNATNGGLTTPTAVHVVANGICSWSNFHRILGTPITVTPNESFGGTILFPAATLNLSNSITVAAWLRSIIGKQVA